MHTFEKYSILVVDDEQSVRDLFHKVLRTRIPSIRIDLATNGSEAVALFREFDYSVILLDVCMPVMNGETTFEEISRLCSQTRRHIPSVIFCTGYDPTDKVKTYAESDSRHCLLSKPVKLAELINTIKQKLSGDPCPRD